MLATMRLRLGTCQRLVSLCYISQRVDAVGEDAREIRLKLRKRGNTPFNANLSASFHAHTKAEAHAKPLICLVEHKLVTL
jgi:hypothetical protein